MGLGIWNILNYDSIIYTKLGTHLCDEPKLFGEYMVNDIDRKRVRGCDYESYVEPKVQEETGKKEKKDTAIVSNPNYVIFFNETIHSSQMSFVATGGFSIFYENEWNRFCVQAIKEEFSKLELKDSWSEEDMKICHNIILLAFRCQDEWLARMMLSFLETKSTSGELDDAFFLYCASLAQTNVWNFISRIRNEESRQSALYTAAIRAFNANKLLPAFEYYVHVSDPFDKLMLEQSFQAGVNRIAKDLHTFTNLIPTIQEHIAKFSVKLEEKETSYETRGILIAQIAEGYRELDRAVVKKETLNRELEEIKKKFIDYFSPIMGESVHEKWAIEYNYHN